MCDQHGVTELDLVAVMQHTIDFRRRIQRACRMAVLKVGFATGFNHAHISVHHHVLGAGVFLDRCARPVVIPVSVTDEQDLDIAILEPKPFDARSNERNIGFQIAVDEDVSLGRGDQVVREALTPNVVQISGYPERRKRLRPVGILRVRSRNKRQ
jgi:hypothetical protein